MAQLQACIGQGGKCDFSHFPHRPVKPPGRMPAHTLTQHHQEGR